MLMQIAALTPNLAAVSSTRFKSLRPDTEGSVTSKTMSTPLKEAITGQPIPGEPSIMASLVALAADAFIAPLTSLTKSPELPLPIFRRAVEKTVSALL